MRQEHVRDLIDAAVDSVLNDLTPSCATVERRGKSGGQFVVTIAPKGKASSEVIVSHSEDDASVFVEVGEATTLELRAQDPDILREELSDVLSTVVNKGFVERTWWYGGTLVYSEAEFSFSWFNPGEISAQFGRRNLLSQAEIRERCYLPYE